MRPISYNDAQIPSHLKAWLLSQQSLTAQLTQLSQGQFFVQPIFEQYQRLSREDAQWLHVPLHHVAWVRESHLYGKDQQIWVKAKSIFPISSLHKKARLFKYIGKKPIGFYLFGRNKPTCKRKIILTPEGWARQSLYVWCGCQFIIQEIFLSTFEQFILQHKQRINK